MKRIQVDPNANDARVRVYSQNVEDAHLYKVDFTKVTTEQSATVSSVAWSNEGQRTMDIASEALSSGIASAYLSCDYRGVGVVKVQATLDNGRKSTAFIEVKVEDPAE